MKKLTILPILLASAMVLFSACNSKQTAEQTLKDDNQRKDIFATVAQSNPYRLEMMNEMMNNDSCKQMMMNKMMDMCKDDSSMCKMMMGKTMEMCDMDESKCKMMKGCLQSHPNVMKSMEGTHEKDNLKVIKDEVKTESTTKGVVYTCPMHPEIIRDKPGKCPKCGMTLVVRK